MTVPTIRSRVTRTSSGCRSQLDQLSAMGFEGGFTQIKYGVVNSIGGQVSVAIGLNETGNLSVTVETALPGRVDDASFAFGIIPRA